MQLSEQVKASVDIVKVIGEYVQLKKVGARYVGLCPFHSEKTPSFNVNSAHQFYKCFGCGVGGDVFTFIQEIEHLPFYEALKLLAERNGIPLPQRPAQMDPDSNLRSALFQMHEIALRHFRQNLLSPQGREAQQYLQNRGVAPAIAEEFVLGLSERSGQALARRFEQEGFGADAMEASGLVLRRNDGSGWFDRFRGRLMFPIQNESGKVIGFGGRALSADDEPKYLNSPETPIYRKSQVLYNLHRAKDAIRKRDQSILVEGYMDVIGVYAAGVREVVASCGTALTSQQIRSLHRLSRNVILNLDPDSAGARASEKSLPLFLREGLKVKILTLDGGLDPDEFIKAHGAEAYQERVSRAQEYFLWLAGRVREKHAGKDIRDRVAALDELLPVVALIPNKVEKTAIATEMAAFLGVDPSHVYRHFRSNATPSRETAVAAAPAPDPVRRVERQLLASLLGDPDLVAEYVPVIRSLEAVRRFSTARIWEAIFEIHEKGESVRYETLEAALPESERALLAGVLMSGAEQEMSAEQAREQANACLRVLISEEQEWQLADLKERIRMAERAGDMAGALRLYEELNRLQRRN